ncbi:hypothetical protein HK100_000833 [Physocladia obscura]|uniref:Uncharacterized protein n=1 Tax=Physocladia obscura TaxID=109957 RepID=A0AAD5XEZ1_9FUNG|nr:hypothetical protein HK100_000833 [Physocladia obscura]
MNINAVLPAPIVVRILAYAAGMTKTAAMPLLALPQLPFFYSSASSSVPDNIVAFELAVLAIVKAVGDGSNNYNKDDNNDYEDDDPDSIMHDVDDGSPETAFTRTTITTIAATARSSSSSSILSSLPHSSHELQHKTRNIWRVVAVGVLSGSRGGAGAGLGSSVDAGRLLSLRRMHRVALTRGGLDAPTLALVGVGAEEATLRARLASHVFIATPALSPAAARAVLAGLVDAKAKAARLFAPCRPSASATTHQESIYQESTQATTNTTAAAVTQSTPLVLPLTGISVVVRPPEFLQQDAILTRNEDATNDLSQVLAAIIDALIHANALYKHHASICRSSSCSYPTDNPLFSLKSLAVHVVTESKGRTAARPETARTTTATALSSLINNGGLFDEASTSEVNESLNFNDPIFVDSSITELNETVNESSFNSNNRIAESPFFLPNNNTNNTNNNNADVVDFDSEWTKSNQLWQRLAKLTAHTIESLQLRVMGPVGVRGWIVDWGAFVVAATTASTNDRIGASTSANIRLYDAVSPADGLRRRHVRIYEEDNGIVNVFDPFAVEGSYGSGSGVSGVAVHQKDEWAQLKQIMYGTSNPTITAASTATAIKSTTLNAHPTYHFYAPTVPLSANPSKKLRILRQDAHGLHFPTLPLTLTTLHLRMPALAMQPTLTHLIMLRHVSLGYGNWDRLVFAGGSVAAGAGGGSAWISGGDGPGRGSGYGMRGGYGIGNGDGESGLAGNSSLAIENVKRLLMSLGGGKGEGRERLETLAVGEIDQKTVKAVFFGFDEDHDDGLDDNDDDDEDDDGDDEVEEDEDHQQDVLTELQIAAAAATSDVAATTITGTIDSRIDNYYHQPSSSSFARAANLLTQHQSRHNHRNGNNSASSDMQQSLIYYSQLPPPPFSALRNLWLRVVPERLSLDRISSIVNVCPALETFDVTYDASKLIEELSAASGVAGAVGVAGGISRIVKLYVDCVWSLDAWKDGSFTGEIDGGGSGGDSKKNWIQVNEKGKRVLQQDMMAVNMKEVEDVIGKNLYSGASHQRWLQQRQRRRRRRRVKLNLWMNDQHFSEMGHHHNFDDVEKRIRAQTVRKDEDGEWSGVYIRD